ncbi:MAG: hypothetical protein A2286_02705 [Gammaproteobacteria bacterium RIFOXYA12_FULL_61_12]|nr:MAG: hypothetical protein A2286_02705 [Gammaproteobacteria bacterium RIFOXYA12_FULL_61_12]OGT89750.1 MAG: hypothetical protein A2514_10360 [Gammaproteobacteria bacterium RIFOXYD12_FULL_61_37]
MGPFEDPDAAPALDAFFAQAEKIAEIYDRFPESAKVPLHEIGSELQACISRIGGLAEEWNDGESIMQALRNAAERLRPTGTIDTGIPVSATEPERGDAPKR